MASQGGQDRLSPYQAMGNNPVSGTDPGGTIVNMSNANAQLVSLPGMNGPSVTNAYFTPSINLNNFNLVGQWIMSSDNGEDALMETFGQSTTGRDAIATNLTMNEGKGSGGGASDDAGGDPQSGGKQNGGQNSGDNGNNNKSPLQDMKDNPPNHPDYKPPKSGPRKVVTPRGKGWIDSKGNVWVPSNNNGNHAPHWDVQHPGANGGYTMSIHLFQLRLKSSVSELL